MDDVCVVFALRRESRAFCRAFRPRQHFTGAPCWARFCGPPRLSVLAVATGVGRDRTERALTWLLSRPKLENVPYRPKVVLGAGFCGALQDGLRTGDVILANEVVDAATGARWPTTWPGDRPDGVWQLLQLRRDRLLTVPHLAAAEEQKRVLGRDWGPAVVDMESATLARLCQQAEVPFGCLRAVLDEAATPLSPRLIALLSGAQASPWRLAAALASAPNLAPELWHLAKRSRLGADQLGKALGEVLTLTLSWTQGGNVHSK